MTHLVQSSAKKRIAIIAGPFTIQHGLVLVGLRSSYGNWRASDSKADRRRKGIYTRCNYQPRRDLASGARPRHRQIDRLPQTQRLRPVIADRSADNSGTKLPAAQRRTVSKRATRFMKAFFLLYLESSMPHSSLTLSCELRDLLRQPDGSYQSEPTYSP